MAAVPFEIGQTVKIRVSSHGSTSIHTFKVSGIQHIPFITLDNGQSYTVEDLLAKTKIAQKDIEYMEKTEKERAEKEAAAGITFVSKISYELKGTIATAIAANEYLSRFNIYNMKTMKQIKTIKDINRHSIAGTYTDNTPFESDFIDLGIYRRMEGGSRRRNSTRKSKKNKRKSNKQK